MNKKLREKILVKYRNLAHFGDAIGMDRRQVNRYVNRIIKPHQITIERFAAGLGIGVDECMELFEVK